VDPGELIVAIAPDGIFCIGLAHLRRVWTVSERAKPQQYTVHASRCRPRDYTSKICHVVCTRAVRIHFASAEKAADIPSAHNSRTFPTSTLTHLFALFSTSSRPLRSCARAILAVPGPSSPPSAFIAYPNRSAGVWRPHGTRSQLFGSSLPVELDLNESTTAHLSRPLRYDGLPPYAAEESHSITPWM
jgi:hypothetical protein